MDIHYHIILNDQYFRNYCCLQALPSLAVGWRITLLHTYDAMARCSAPSVHAHAWTALRSTMASIYLVLKTGPRADVGWKSWDWSSSQTMPIVEPPETYKTELNVMVWKKKQNGFHTSPPVLHFASASRRQKLLEMASQDCSWHRESPAPSAM